MNRRVKTRESEAPAEPPHAGPRCEQLQAFLRSSRNRCSVHGRDAAQQELRPPGSAFCQKVKAIGRKPNGLDFLWNPVNRRVKTRENEAPAEPPHAGPRCEQLPAFLQSSRNRCSVHGRDAAQQELRPPGTDSRQKVNAIGRKPAVCVSHRRCARRR